MTQKVLIIDPISLEPMLLDKTIPSKKITNTKKLLKKINLLSLK
jgi:hypothetical protein